MKRNIILIIVSLIGYVCHGQTIVYKKDVHFKSDTCYYEKKLYTGKLIEPILYSKPQAFIQSSYVNGLKDGVTLTKNEIFKYKNGIIIEYRIVDAERSIVYTWNNSDFSNIVDIIPGIKLQGQVDDTLFNKEKHSEKTTIGYSLGLWLISKNKKKSFVEVNEFEIESYNLWAVTSWGADIWETLKGNTMNCKYFKNCSVLQLDHIKLRTSKGLVIKFDNKQKIYLK